MAATDAPTLTTSESPSSSSGTLRGAPCTWMIARSRVASRATMRIGYDSFRSTLTSPVIRSGLKKTRMFE